MRGAVCSSARVHLSTNRNARAYPAHASSHLIQSLQMSPLIDDLVPRDGVIIFIEFTETSMILLTAEASTGFCHITLTICI